PAVGVDCAAGTDQRFPPTRRGMPVAELAGGVTVAGQGMAHEHGVVGRRRQLTPGLVGQLGVPEHPATLEPEGPVLAQVRDPSSSTPSTTPTSSVPSSPKGAPCSTRTEPADQSRSRRNIQSTLPPSEPAATVSAARHANATSGSENEPHCTSGTRNMGTCASTA